MEACVACSVCTSRKRAKYMERNCGQDYSTNCFNSSTVKFSFKNPLRGAQLKSMTQWRVYTSNAVNGLNTIFQLARLLHFSRANEQRDKNADSLREKLTRQISCSLIISEIPAIVVGKIFTKYPERIAKEEKRSVRGENSVLQDFKKSTVNEGWLNALKLYVDDCFE